jgi:hypothetical protein
MMKNAIILLLTVIILTGLSSCKDQSVNPDGQTPLVSVKTTSVMQGDIENTINLNGKTIYLKKNMIVSPISGYISKMNIKFGDKVQKNDVLFVIQTRENKALENTNTFTSNVGLIKVLASSDGIIDELNISETGGYIVEGSQLCSIVENNDLMVQVNVPFEYNKLVRMNMKCKLLLSDNTNLYGLVHKILPVINETDQTQNVLIKPVQPAGLSNRQLPENLNLIVEFINAKHCNSLLVNKKALMTNEMQNEFWVMKIVDDSIAIKVPVAKDIENDSIVEISSTDLIKNDLVIIEGAYGLADSAVVRIVE